MAGKRNGGSRLTGRAAKRPPAPSITSDRQRRQTAVQTTWPVASMASPAPSPESRSAGVAVARKCNGEPEAGALQELNALCISEILDQDLRPTFVLDLDQDYNQTGSIRPVFCNVALSQHDYLLDSILEGADQQNANGWPSGESTHEAYVHWATSTTSIETRRSNFQYEGLLWTCSTLRSRWRLISGTAFPQASDHTAVPTGNLDSSSQTTTSNRDASHCSPPRQNDFLQSDSPVAPKSSDPQSDRVRQSESKATSDSGASITFATPEEAVPDLFVANPRGILSDHHLFVRSIDWSSTSLGPMETWSVEFREVLNLVMRNRFPAALFWGPDLNVIYNEAYKNEVAGNKHPELMGTGFSGPFSELWDGVSPIFRECARTGTAVRQDNDMLPIERFGYLEETFFSWSIIPVYGGGERILGFYNAPFETTYSTVRSRRMTMLQQLGECLNATRTIKEFWKRVLAGLESNPFDVPFALLYSIMDLDENDTAAIHSDGTLALRSCLLEGTIGVPSNHAASPQTLDLKRSQNGFVPAFREAMRTREPTKYRIGDGTLPDALLEGFEWRGYGDPCEEVIIFPVRPTNGNTVFAFLLIGVNPRRAYDQDYQAFAAMLNRQLATSLASLLLFEDEVRRSRKEAELAVQQRQQLSEQLELQTNRMRKMTEMSPLGMYLYNTDGVLLEANDRFYEMTGAVRDDEQELSFLKIVAGNSLETAMDMWRETLQTAVPTVRELQFHNAQYTPKALNGEPIDYWVLATSQLETGPDGETISIMGSITDISQLKWAQGLQETRLREAEETKRQQNEFIDITSHEMRNPLSAILICADDIRDTLKQHFFRSEDYEVVYECIEAANNIALCVQHQKSIVDDILTISKLDSNLLLITPIPTQPIAVLRQAMSMFNPEVQAKDINFTLALDPSLQTLNVDWVLLDPTRLLQITVNLITNAIKFTQNCPRRTISVHVRVSPEIPNLSAQGFQFVPKRASGHNITSSSEWGNGQLLHLCIEVEDTGCGLSVEEKELLFERFAQASPRTHAHYGGSGLGLFISRQLAELHGGQIGVSSEAGVGSTFGFFLQCRRLPSNDTRLVPSPAALPKDTPDYVTISQELAASVASHDERSHISAQPSGAGTPLHVLIVEDNVVNLNVLKKQLTKAGCICSVADNGLRALEHLRTTTLHRSSRTSTSAVPLNIILLDWEMPVMNGLECCERIREMERSGELLVHVPVIGVTANVRAEQLATAKVSGMDDVVGKPFKVRDLLKTMEELIDRLGREDMMD